MSRSWNSRFVGTIVYSDNIITSTAAACVTRVVATVTRRRRRNHRVNGGEKKKNRVGPQLIPRALGRLGIFPGCPLSPPGDDPSRYDASDQNSRAGRGAPNTYPNYLNSRNVRMVNHKRRVDNKSVKVGQVHADGGVVLRVRDLLVNL